MEQFSAMNPNPILRVEKEGTVLYSNNAGFPLLHEWGVKVGEKLPPYYIDIVEGVTSTNSPQRIEVKVENQVYLVSFYPSPEEDCANIYGFDISDQKEFEEKLRESENKYRNIVETTNEGVWIFNSVSETTYVNEKMAEMLGYKPKEMIGRFIWDFAYEEDKGIFQVKLVNRMQGIDEVYELKLIRKDGSHIWVSVSAKAFFDGVGKFAGSVGMFTDTTDRKRAEQELRESEERFRSAFDDSAVAMALVGPDAHLLKVNDAFCRLIGFKKSEMESRTFLDFTYPDDTNPSILAHKAVINSEKPFLWIEKRYIRKDGRVIWCEVSSSAIHDSKGCPIYTIAHVQDITERKKAEEALRLSNLYNRSLIEASLDPLVTIGYDGKITDVNGATEEVTGHSRNDLIGTDFSDYFTEPEKARMGYQQVFTDGKVWDYPLEIQHKDGYITPVLYNASVYRDENGEVIGVFASARDIAERMKVEEALKKAHDNLEEKVKERTAELEKAYNLLKENETSLSEAQKIAHIGNWDWNIVTNEIYCSDELYRIFGLNPKETTATYNSFLSHYVHPDDLERIDDAVKKALKGEPYSIDNRIITANGEERIVHAQTEILFDIKNNPVRIRGVLQDITERKKAEKKIQGLANIVESSNDAIGTISLGGIITSWNKGAEQVYGYSAEEVIGKTVSILAPSPLDEETKKLSEKIKKGEKVHRYETLRLRKDGKIIDVSMNLSPVFDVYGKLTAISFIVRDITERKEAEESLANIEIARKKEIHHRIKNNLQVISSLLDLQAEKFRDRECVEDSEVMKAFRESQERVMSIALIHEELHEGRGNDTLNFSPYLERLVKNLFQTYRLGNVDTRLNLDIEENIFFDMDLAVPLGIIINELVSNSLKYAFPCNDKGLIQIKLCREEAGESTNNIIGSEKVGCKITNFILTVLDNGVGIPESFNSECSDSLGLQLVTILVDQLNGELEMERNNGTEFTIRFRVIEKK